MKKLLLSVGILLGAVAIFYSCDGDNAPEIKKPTELTVSDIGTSTATLSWNGDADAYEVMVGGQTAAVTAKTYVAENLTAGTQYTWKVRSKKGDKFSEWADGATFTTVTEPAIPTNLQVGAVTQTTADLSWEGDAPSYEIMVGTVTNTVTDKTYTAADLTADTPYTWKVRAQEGNVFSEWVDGLGFTTQPATPDGLEVTGFHVPGFIEFYGDHYSKGVANNFVIAIFQEGLMDWATGTGVYMDIYTSLSATTEIPAGTYKVSASYAPGTISGDDSGYETYESGESLAEAEFVSGSATISVASGVYTIDFSFVAADGVRVWGTYVGTLEYSDYSDEMEDQGAPSMQRTPWTFGGGKIMPHRK